LSDDKFDELLKHKAESANFDFDEAAWEKMEHKLRKRDRGIFLRNTGFVLALLFISTGAFFLLDNNLIPKNQKFAKSTRTKKVVDTIRQIQATEVNPSLETVNPDIDNYNKQVLSASKAKYSTPPEKHEIKTGRESTKDLQGEYNIPQQADSSLITAVINTDPLKQTASATDKQPAEISDSILVIKDERKQAERHRLAFSVTALAGPEFSSIKSIAGNQGTLTTGLLINAALSKRVTLSSGLKYGFKNYQATAFDYKIESPYAKYASGIDASCKILEVPLQASYTLSNYKNRKIAVSTGLSSYFMLSEKYTFKYEGSTRYKDFELVKTNANRHYLSVVSLSASYQIKSKSSHMYWAVEPFVKLPLGGVGEGKVRLKSSGVSLNLTYDLSKKIK
jgi:hypothetical protein